jgi:PilZ domain
MTARLPRLVALDARIDQPRALTRKSERRLVTGAVVIQSNAGERTSARLRDISVYGCNLACEADWLRMGRFITLRLGKDRTIQAIVRWTREGMTGIEFLRPISDAEAEVISGLQR